MNLYKRSISLLALLLLFVSSSLVAQTSDTYYPDRFHWEMKSPEEVGMTAPEVQEAVVYAQDNESTNPRDLSIHLNTRTNEPYNNIIGPVKERGPATGMIIKDGYLIAEWGEPHRVDDFQCHQKFLIHNSRCCMGQRHDRKYR